MRQWRSYAFEEAATVRVQHFDLGQIHALTEALRKQAIGEPQWIADKHVYEYEEKSPEVVAVLKLTRAVHGLSAMLALCQAGLFIDFGAVIRCVNDSLEDAYFLLENYPGEASGNVNKFIQAFFENTIDGYQAPKTIAVSRDKIRSAVVRILRDGQDEATRKLMENIYITFCGYVHANYAHIMEVYNGATRDFNLAGVPSEHQKAMRVEHVEVAAESVLHCAAFVAHKFGLRDIYAELVRCIRGRNKNA